MRDAHIQLPGGRELAFTEIGPSDGRPVFFFHGAPMSRLTLVGLEDQFAERGIRVISPDRPGYGRSSPQPGRSMADWPGDVVALADALGIDQFVVAAHSSGGPYAVACAALIPERVAAGVIAAGVTEMTWPAAREGYLEDEIRIMALPDEAEAVAWCTERYGADGSGMLSDSIELPEPDLAFLASQGSGQALLEALRQGVNGYAQDIHVQGRPWPFDPSDIGVPVAVLHGELDSLVPIAHGRHTADLIPGAGFQALPDHGHLSILSEIPEAVPA